MRNKPYLEIKSIDISDGDLLPILNAIDQGILITNKHAVITFYNHSHACMDGLTYNDVIGRKVFDVYELNEESSLVYRCLKIGEPIIDCPTVYKARNGRVVNSINNVFPLVKNGIVIGAISFVKDYEFLDGLMNPEGGTSDKQMVIEDTRFSFSDIIGVNPLLLAAVTRSRMAANSNASVLLYGETGTGKELLAQSIHNHSHRKKGRCIAVNCAAIPESLLEGILFGTTRGAFTGAIDKPGLLEQANGGTLFLDEINSMAMALQPKLLRVIQEKKVCRVGALNETHLDLRIIGSINVEPQVALAKGTLRSDLLYRLGVVYIAIPPLRDRTDDISLLTEHFIEKFNSIYGVKVVGISPRVNHYLHQYHWPGNVRELENVIEGAMNMINTETIINTWHLSSLFPGSQCSTKDLPREGDRLTDSDSAPTQNGGHSITFPWSKSGWVAHHPGSTQGHNEIEAALQVAGGNVSEAALVLGISRQCLHQKLKNYRIDRKKIAAETEKERVVASLKANDGNITRAAKSMGISRQLMAYKIKKHGVDRQNP